MIEMLGRLVAAEARAAELVARLEAQVGAARARAEARSALVGRPRVYFEEWDEPNITAVQWVSELIEVAGGDNIFAERAAAPLARDRILADPEEVVRRNPEIIIGSWCGKHFRPERVAARPGWDGIAAVRAGRLHEIKSAIILTPGIAAIRDGLPLLEAILAAGPA
jgi:iron complex transport system substrate-binding protein